MRPRHQKALDALQSGPLRLQVVLDALGSVEAVPRARSHKHPFQLFDFWFCMVIKVYMIYMGMCQSRETPWRFSACLRRVKNHEPVVHKDRLVDLNRGPKDAEGSISPKRNSKAIFGAPPKTILNMDLSLAPMAKRVSPENW